MTHDMFDQDQGTQCQREQSDHVLGMVCEVTFDAPTGGANGCSVARDLDSIPVALFGACRTALYLRIVRRGVEASGALVAARTEHKQRVT